MQQKEAWGSGQISGEEGSVLTRMSFNIVYYDTRSLFFIYIFGDNHDLQSQL